MSSWYIAKKFWGLSMRRRVQDGLFFCNSNPLRCTLYCLLWADFFSYFLSEWEKTHFVSRWKSSIHCRVSSRILFLYIKVCCITYQLCKCTKCDKDVWDAVIYFIRPYFGISFLIFSKAAALPCTTSYKFFMATVQRLEVYGRNGEGVIFQESIWPH